MSSSKLLSASALVVCWLAAVSFAGTIRADRTQTTYLGLAKKFIDVGRFDITDRQGGAVASGTLIAPDWVLTAAHVVDKATALDFTIGGQTYAAADWWAYPNWTGGLGAGYDIGLVKLSDPVTGIKPAKLYTGNDELGQVATLVGYGMTGTGWTGARSFDGKMRAGRNTIDAFVPGSGGRAFMVDFDSPVYSRLFNQLGSPEPLNREYLIAPGDSGGPVFIRVNGTYKIAGVNSFGQTEPGYPYSAYGTISGHTRVSAFDPWIDRVLRQHGGTSRPLDLPAGGAGLTPLEYSVPEPASLALLAAGAVLLRPRRVRRSR